MYSLKKEKKMKRVVFVYIILIKKELYGVVEVHSKERNGRGEGKTKEKEIKTIQEIFRRR